MNKAKDWPSSSPDSNVKIIPMFSCTMLERTLRHYSALGFRVTYEQHAPYVYGATEWRGVEVHFLGTKTVDPERGSSCLVMLDDIEGTYDAFVHGLRRAHEGLPVKGFPRITRLRKGHTRFSVYDWDGNSLQFIANDEPEYDYESNVSEGDDSTFGRTLSGISRTQSSLMQALEAAVFLRDTYHDDQAAARKLDNALSQVDNPAPVEYARTLAARAEIAVALGETERARSLRQALADVPLSDEERSRWRDELESADQLERLMEPPG